MLGENGFHTAASPAGSVMASAVVDARGQHLGQVGSFPKLRDVAAMWAGNQTVLDAYADAPVNLVRTPQAWPKPQERWADAGRVGPEANTREAAAQRSSSRQLGLAQASGVLPLLSRAVLSAPAASSSRTQSGWPYRAAMCSGR